MCAWSAMTMKPADDHKHTGDNEVDYVFAGLDALQADFWADIERRLKR